MFWLNWIRIGVALITSELGKFWLGALQSETCRGLPRRFVLCVSSSELYPVWIRIQSYLVEQDTGPERV